MTLPRLSPDAKKSGYDLAMLIMKVEMTMSKSDLFRGRQSRGTPKCASTQVIVPGSSSGRTNGNILLKRTAKHQWTTGFV